MGIETQADRDAATDKAQELLPVESLRGQILDIIHDTLEAEYVGTYIAGMDEAAGKIAALLSESISHSLPEIALPKRCDGIEQPAFEEWAKAQGFDMTEHPLHYLFLDAKTDAARQGWAAGLKHASDRVAAALTPTTGQSTTPLLEEEV